METLRPTELGEAGPLLKVNKAIVKLHAEYFGEGTAEGADRARRRGPRPLRAAGPADPGRAHAD
jgi:hypothetical protein